MALSTDFQVSGRFRFLKALMVIAACDGPCTLLLPDFSFLKYAAFLAIFAIAAGSFLASMSLTTFPMYPLGFLILSLVSIFSLWAAQGEESGISYSSALFPMMLVGLTAFIPLNQSRLDFEKTLMFFGLLSTVFVAIHVSFQLLHLFWKFVPEDWFAMTIHENTFFAVYALCLAALLRRWRLVGLLGVLTIVSLLIRPSSTFIIGLAVGAAISAGFLMNRQSIAVILGNGVLILLMLFPPVFLMQPEFAGFLLSLEPMFKEDLLGSVSNNSFRLVVFELARDAMLKTSWVFGQGFAGSTNVDVGLAIDGWQTATASAATASQAPVHSDFMIMLWQGGAVGYGLFALSLIAVVLHLSRSLQVVEAARSIAALTLLRSLYVLIIVFGVYISFNPILQKYSFSYLFWFPLLIVTLACRQVRSWEGQAATIAQPVRRYHNG